MKKLVFIVKVTDACNLRCKYCYNSCLGYKGNVLSLENFEKALKLFPYNYTNVDIIWHGGEPMLCGVDYYEKAMAIEKEIMQKYPITIANRIQTNGTLIDKKWVKFFKKNDFKVGISFDGVDNEEYRGLTEKTLNGMELLKKSGVGFASIAVCASPEYDLVENYELFKEMQVGVDFSAVYNEGGGKDLQDRSANKFASDMCSLFDHWLYDTNGVDVRTFSTFMLMALGKGYKICNYCSCHGKFLCIDSVGNFYNCARSSMQDYLLGNVNEVEKIDELWHSEGFARLLKGAIERRNKCKDCEYFSVCQSNCSDTAIFEKGLNNIAEEACLRFKVLFSYIKEKTLKILEEKVDLSKLNPAVKKAFTKCFTISNNAIIARDMESYE